MALLVLAWSIQLNSDRLSRECSAPTCDNVDIAVDVAALVAGPVVAVIFGSLVLGMSRLRGRALNVIAAAVAVANAVWMMVEGWPAPDESQQDKAIGGLIFMAVILWPTAIACTVFLLRWLASRQITGTTASRHDVVPPRPD